MWCGLCNEFGAPPQHPRLPRLPRMPGVLPVPTNQALRLTALTGLLLNCTVPPIRQVRSQELFLSDAPEELPDHPVRQALDHERLRRL